MNLWQTLLALWDWLRGRRFEDSRPEAEVTTRPGDFRTPSEETSKRMLDEVPDPYRWKHKD